MVRFRRLVGGLVLVGMTAVIAACGGSAAPAAKPATAPAATPAPAPAPAPATTGTTFVTIGTGPVGGAYYAVGAGMAKLLTGHLPKTEGRVEVTSGALENPGLVSSGKLDMGITNGNVAAYALVGAEMFKGKATPNIALAIGGLATGALHIGVLEDSPVKSLADLKGRKIAVGPQGGTVVLLLSQILSEFGIGPNDYKPSYLDFGDGVNALSDGTVDAALISTAPPAAQFTELGAKKKFRLVPVAPDKISAIVKKYPYYTGYTINKSVYKLTDDTLTVGTPNVIIVRKDLSTDAVYNMIKAVFENLKELQNSHPSAKSIAIETAPLGGIPLHPGAEKFYKEKGVLK